MTALEVFNLKNALIDQIYEIYSQRESLSAAIRRGDVDDWVGENMISLLNMQISSLRLEYDALELI